MTSDGPGRVSTEPETIWAAADLGKRRGHRVARGDDQLMPQCLEDRSAIRPDEFLQDVIGGSQPPYDLRRVGSVQRNLRKAELGQTRVPQLRHPHP
jgi:hypothetical protein